VGGPQPIPRELIRANDVIAKGEIAKRPDLISPVLHNELVFRRADGNVTDKSGYLAGVLARDYDVLEPHSLGSEVSVDSAVLTLSVLAAGNGPKGRFSGVYFNTRLFIREGQRWLLRAWLNTPVGLQPRLIHHAAVPVRDVARSKEFYGEVLGLLEIKRPRFDFGGAWYGVGDQQLHLIEHPEGTFRRRRAGLDSHDVHFALRVESFTAALARLAGYGYRVADVDHGAMVAAAVGLPVASLVAAPADIVKLVMKVNLKSRTRAPFWQVFVVDPDDNIVEINARDL
jgi:glyoxylase I family protein